MFRRLWVKVLMTVFALAVLRLAFVFAIRPPLAPDDAAPVVLQPGVRPKVPLNLVVSAVGVEVGSTILITLLIAVPLVRRIRRLARETRAVLDDDLQGSVPEGADELGEMGRAFNEASRAARARMDEQRRRDERIRTALQDLAHDVRTPLASIKLGIDRLVSEPGSDVATATLRAHVDHLDRLFSNVAAAIQLDGSGIPFERRSMNVSDIVERVVSRFRLIAASRGIALHLHLPPHPLPASIDPIAFEQAVGNLVDNAVKFGRANVAVLTFERDGAVVVQVRDDGPGFDGEDVTNLIGRGIRGRASQGRVGYGLGLAIANEIASRLGGRMTLTAHSEGGAQVEIVLPTSQRGAESS